MKLTVALLLLFLAAQGTFWYKTRDIMPDMSIVPDVPGAETVHALSLGDSQFFFRLLGLQLQSAGDTFGRSTALYKYDYHKLYHWFRLLDTLDDESNFIPSMATYYYSQSQNVADVKYVVDYLIEHAAHRVEQKWWWLVQASYLANHKLKDIDLALKAAHYLQTDADIPVWAKQMPAFMYEQKGEFDAALKIIENIMQHSDEIKPGELNFMQYFVDERLGRLEKIEESINAKRKAQQLQQKDLDEPAQ